MNIKLLTEVKVLVDTYETSGDTMTLDEIMDIRRLLASKLFGLQDLIKDIKKEWRTAEYDRRCAVGQREVDLLKDKNEKGKSHTQHDRHNMAIIASKEEYEREIEAEANYDKIRIAIEGVKQVLNSMAAIKN